MQECAGEGTHDSYGHSAGVRQERLDANFRAVDSARMYSWHGDRSQGKVRLIRTLDSMSLTPSPQRSALRDWARPQAPAAPRGLRLCGGAGRGAGGRGEGGWQRRKRPKCAETGSNSRWHPGFVPAAFGRSAGRLMRNLKPAAPGGPAKSCFCLALAESGCIRARCKAICAPRP